MSTYRWANLGLLIVLLLLVLATSRPGAVLAESATVNYESSLLENPWPDAAVLTVVPAGAIVELAGPPSDGYYPVTLDASYGYLPAESLAIHKEEPEAGTLPVDASDLAAVDAVADPSLAESGVPVDPASGVGGMEAPVADPAAEVEPAPAAAPVAQAPIPDPNPENLVVAPESGPTGPASVTTDAPVLLGPGPEFGLLASAPAGSMVEQTGNVVNGWVTVKFAEITGWAPLDRLGPPLAYGDPEADATDPVAAATDPATASDPGAITDPAAIDPAMTDPAAISNVPAASGEATPVGA